MFQSHGILQAASKYNKFNQLQVKNVVLHIAKPTDENLRDEGVYQAFASAYINTSEKFTNDISHKNFNAMVNNCIECHEKFCLGTIQKINKLYIRK